MREQLMQFIQPHNRRRLRLIFRPIEAAVLVSTIVFVFVAGCASSKIDVATVDQPQSTLRNTVGYLADDAREGRGIGSAGLNASAEFIADRFAALHLRQLPGCSGYFQPFEMNVGIAPDSTTFLKSDDKTYTVESDYIPLGLSAQKEFSGEVVFAGYGVVDPSKQYDDYADMDVKGKVVLVFRHEPMNDAGESALTGKDWSPRVMNQSKARLAEQKGAVALLTVTGPLNPGDKTLSPPTPGGRASIPMIQITQEAADALLRRGGLPDLKSLQSNINHDLKPHSAPLANVKLSGAVAFKKTMAPVRNVVALLPGRTDEYVVVGAHYDHLGRGEWGHTFATRGQIHNGADDNASGTAALLELARQMTLAGRQRRGIIFALFTAEEEGLVGSDYFVKHSPVPLDKIVAMLNLDMVGRVRNEKILVGGSGTAEQFRPMLEEDDVKSPLELGYIGRGGRGPSDHMSFGVKKIPVLFLFSGLHSDYHRPTDDTDKINFTGLAEVVDLARTILRQMAARPRPTYVDRYDSEPALFDRAATTSTAPSTGPTAEPHMRAALGVVPDYGTDESQAGVRIIGVSEGSAAQLAGLKEGDVVTHAGDMRILNLYDLTEFLNRSNPGDKVKISFMRDGTSITVAVVLKARQAD